MKKLFFPRKVYFNKTFLLVKKTSFVITLRSTSLNYGVIHNKPILFITSNQFTEEVKRYIEILSNYFNLKPININQKINEKDIQSFKDFNFKKLKKFKYDYITTLKNRIPNYKIILKNINLI